MPLATWPRSGEVEFPLEIPDLFIHKASSSSGEILNQLSSANNKLGLTSFQTNVLVLCTLNISGVAS